MGESRGWRLIHACHAHQGRRASPSNGEGREETIHRDGARTAVYGAYIQLRGDDFQYKNTTMSSSVNVVARTVYRALLRASRNADRNASIKGLLKRAPRQYYNRMSNTWESWPNTSIESAFASAQLDEPIAEVKDLNQRASFFRFFHTVSSSLLLHSPSLAGRAWIGAHLRRLHR